MADLMSMEESFKKYMQEELRRVTREALFTIYINGYMRRPKMKIRGGKRRERKRLKYGR